MRHLKTEEKFSYRMCSELVKVLRLYYRIKDKIYIFCRTYSSFRNGFIRKMQIRLFTVGKYIFQNLLYCLAFWLPFHLFPRTCSSPSPC